MGKRKMYMTIDTETYGDVNYPYAFDIGGIVHDAYNNEIERFSFCIFDTYVLHNDEVQQCFYKNKLPIYDRELLAGTRILATLYTIRQHMLDLVNKYDISAILAYNASFDYRSMRNAWRLTPLHKTQGFWDDFPPIYCTMEMCYDTIFKHKKYTKFCEANNLVSPKTGRPRHKAETAKQYMDNDPTFVEEHIGIHDCEIEVEIFHYVKRQRKKLRMTDRNKREK